MYNTKARRKELLKFREYKCEQCGNTGSWNGETLALQVDHIDGDSTNNSISNLRFLCPNCHSQTSTFTGRNARTKVWNRPSKEEFLELLKQHTVKEISILKAVSLRVVYNWFNFYVKEDKASSPRTRKFSCEQVSTLRNNKTTSEFEAKLYQVSSKLIRQIRRKELYCDCN